MSSSIRIPHELGVRVVWDLYCFFVMHACKTYRTLCEKAHMILKSREESFQNHGVLTLKVT